MVETLRELYLRYGCCMAYVAIEREGQIGIGSAFHVGEGVFVTARHVLENAKVTEIRLTDAGLYYRSSLYPKDSNGSYTILPGVTPPLCLNRDGFIEIDAGPFFHPDTNVDVAAFKAKGMAPGAHFVPLGGHLDDWIGCGDFELTQAIVLGYPPIPLTITPWLVVVRSDVNAVVDLPGSKAPVHFILSAIPRGGFSGGLALSEFGFVIGTVSQSLLTNDSAPELGFFATTSVECIYDCLRQNNILPECQKQGWDGLWD